MEWNDIDVEIFVPNEAAQDRFLYGWLGLHWDYLFFSSPSSNRSDKISSDKASDVRLECFV